MLTYDLLWTVSFPSFCLIAMWFSMALALLARSESGRCKRKEILESDAEVERYHAAEPQTQCRGSKGVLRRAIVMVGGDFARSPRMQNHVFCLAKCGMFDEVVLVGFDMRNSLNECINAMDSNRSNDTNGECIVDTRYLIQPLLEPSWFCLLTIYPQLHWVALSFYQICIHTLVFIWTLLRASLLVVNSAGQLIITDLILVQSPPALPFMLLIKYCVRPLALVGNLIFYYLLIVPTSCIKRDALSEIREGLKRQHRCNKSNLNNAEATHSARSVMCPALIVDWHNFGYTILRENGRPSVIVWLYKFLECHFCFGTRNVTVSKTMQRALHLLSGVEKQKGKNGRDNGPNGADTVVLLYDTPLLSFSEVPRKCFVEEVLLPAMRSSGSSGGEVMGCSPPPAWILQAVKGETSKLDADRSGLFIIASTSWTLEDDYSMVVKALVRLDERLKQRQEQQQKEDNSSPFVTPIWLLVTGKGPSRERFERSVAEAQLSSLVTVSTLYLQSRLQYAMTLGAADVGLCMHHSCSGLDLPMKAVDMLGSGLPVLALHYDALTELLDERYGWLFKNAEELEQIVWQDLLFEKSSLERKRKMVMLKERKNWSEEWTSVFLPILEDLL